MSIQEVIDAMNATNESAILEEKDLESLERLSQDGGKIFVIISGVLMLAFVLGNLLHVCKVSWLPESLLVVALGAVIGLILPMGNTSVTTWAIKHITIQEESIINEMTLNWFLLPMIIFEAGWSLKHQDFISQFPYILLFAIFGTLISMGVVAGLILGTGELHGVTQPRTAFAYAALISAVDPVATLATYAHLNVDPLLNTLVFGESVINDAVAIVLFKTLNDMPEKDFEDLTGGQLAGKLALGVLQLLTASLGLGIGISCVYILLMRFTKMHHSPSLSALFVFFSCFFTYNMAESGLGQSGIIAVLFSGMLMGGFATPHLKPSGTRFASFLLKQMASIGDMIVFLFVGIAVVYVKQNGLTFGCWISLFCLAGRLVATVPLGLLTNALKSAFLKKYPREKRHMLTWQHILMMWHAGLRGGIALVLTLELGEWVDTPEYPQTREKLRNATLVVICAFLLIFGGSTECMLTLLKVPMGDGVKPLQHHRGKTLSCWERFRDRVMIPVLVGEIPDDHGGVDVDDEGGHDGPQRRPSQTETNSQLYDLYGTSDPTHSQEVALTRRDEDGLLRRTLTGGGNSWEEGSSEEDSDDAESSDRA